MHKINLLSREGAASHIFYDHVANRFLGPDGASLLSSDEIRHAPVQGISPSSPGLKGGDVKRLKIQLGLKCNYSCSYCLQSSHIPDASITHQRDALEFIERIDEWLVGDPDQIEFWGGEPLVYIKKLLVLAPALRERFPHSDFLLITNGSLLTDEVVTFLVDNNFTVAVSHDGPGQSLRGDDPLDNPVVDNACRRLIAERPGRFSFNSVLTSKNTDIRAIVAWFAERFGESVPFNFEGIVSYYDEQTLNSSRLTDLELKQIEQEIAYELGNGVLDATVFGRKLELFFDSLDSPVTIDSMYSKCGMDRPDYLAVDLSGAVTTCQNTGATGVHNAGSVYALDDVRLTSSTHFSHRSNCDSCEMLRICGGSCMYQHGRDFSESCRADYAQAMGVFKAAVWRLFGVAVTSVERYRKNEIPVHQL